MTVVRSWVINSSNLPQGQFSLPLLNFSTTGDLDLEAGMLWLLLGLPLSSRVRSTTHCSGSFFGILLAGAAYLPEAVDIGLFKSCFTCQATNPPVLQGQYVGLVDAGVEIVFLVELLAHILLEPRKSAAWFEGLRFFCFFLFFFFFFFFGGGGSGIG